MASGILGQSNPTAATNTTVYTVPAGVTATATISVTNLSGDNAIFNFAVSASATPGASEWIMYNTQVPPSSTVERSGVVAQTGKNFVINASSSNLSVSVYGFEN